MVTSMPYLDAAQYGAPVGEFRGSMVRRVVLSLGALALIAAGGGFVVLAMTSAKGDASGMAIVYSIGALFILGALFCLYTLFSWRGTHAQLFERGFIITQAGKTLSARWEDVTTVTQHIVKQSYNGIPVGTSYQFDVTVHNGEKMRVNNGFEKTGALGAALQRMSTNAIFPRIFAAFQNGASVPFGKLSVSQAGISNGKDTLPWNEFKQITVANGSMIVSRQGKAFRWASVPLRKMENVYVFIALVNQVRGAGQ